VNILSNNESVIDTKSCLNPDTLNILKNIYIDLENKIKEVHLKYKKKKFHLTIKEITSIIFMCIILNIFLFIMLLSFPDSSYHSLKFIESFLVLQPIILLSVLMTCYGNLFNFSRISLEVHKDTEIVNILPMAFQNIPNCSNSVISEQINEITTFYNLFTEEKTQSARTIPDDEEIQKLQDFVFVDLQNFFMTGILEEEIYKKFQVLKLQFSESSYLRRINSIYPEIKAN